MKSMLKWVAVVGMASFVMTGCNTGGDDSGKSLEARISGTTVYVHDKALREDVVRTTFEAGPEHYVRYEKIGGGDPSCLDTWRVEEEEEKLLIDHCAEGTGTTTYRIDRLDPQFWMVEEIHTDESDVAQRWLVEQKFDLQALRGRLFEQATNGQPKYRYDFSPDPESLDVTVTDEEDNEVGSCKYSVNDNGYLVFYRCQINSDGEEKTAQVAPSHTFYLISQYELEGEAFYAVWHDLNSSEDDLVPLKGVNLLKDVSE